MRILRSSLTVVLCGALLLPVRAQQWQLVTPIKNRSDLVAMRMVGPTTAFTIDRALGFVLRTTDAGINWDRMPFNMSISPPKALWMWDDQRGVIAASAGRFYRTADGFNTINTTITAFGNASCLFFLDDTLGFAGTEDGKILRTEDAGVNWVQQVSGVIYNINSIFFVNDTLGFASALGSYLLRTTNGGTTWEQLTPPDVVNIKDLHFFDALHGIGVGSVGNIVRTDDGGDTWTFVTSPTTATLLDLEVHGNVLVACGYAGRMIRSTDGGDTWTEQIHGTRDHYATGINAQGIGLSGTDGGVWRTLDFGATWQQVQVGTAHSMLNKVSFGTDQKGATVGWITMGGFETTLMRTSDGGRHWTGSISTSGGLLGVHLRADGAGAFGGSIGANGHTADYFATTTPGTAPSLAIRATWAFSPTTYIVAGGYVGAGFYRTTNGGSTWNFTSGGTIYDLYFPSDLVGYAGGEGGVLEKTIDGGVTWTPLTSPTSGDIYSVFFLNDTLGWTIGAGSGHRTSDGGQTWTLISNLPQYTMSIFFTDADTGYAVSSSGYAYESTDGGDNWTQIVDAPFDVQIGDAALADGALIAVGRFGDIYRAEINCPVTPQVPSLLYAGDELCTAWSPGIQWYVDGDLLPDANTPCLTPVVPGSYTVVVTSALGCVSAPSAPVQVVVTAMQERSTSAPLLFPNPVRNILNITLASPGTHRIDLLDAQGRVVRTLVATGTLLTLDASDLRPGLYALRCTSDGLVVTQRFVKE